MRFLSTAILAVSAFAYVSALPQSTADGTASESSPAPAPTDTPEPPTGNAPNPISSPTSGTVCKAKEPCTIEWQPTTDGTVTLKLRMGDSENLDTVEVIDEDIPNTGSYTWTPDEDLKGDDTYAIEIVSEDGESNYSPKFTIDSEGEGISSSSSSSTTKSSSTTTKAPSTTISSIISTATVTSNGTTTPTSRTNRPTPTDDEGEDDEEAPNPNDSGAASGLLAMHSPLALILCVGAAMAYLS